MAKRLKPVDWFEGQIFAEDETYLYQLDNAGDLNRIPRNDLGTPEELSDISAFAGTPQSSVVRLSTGTFLIQVGTGSSALIQRSTDGTSWTTVHTPNWGALASRGMAVIELEDGSEAVLFGEYRTSGTTSDDNALVLLTNDGQTATVLNAWKYTLNTRHIHYVGQDPYTKAIYIGFGDNDNEAGIIRVEQSQIANTTAWASLGDTAPRNVNAAGIAGFTGVGGTQKTRATDIVYTSQYAYSHADAGASGGDSEIGIWRFNKDLTGFQRLDSSVLADAESAGFWALAVGNELWFCNYVSGTAGTDNFIKIWGVTEGGKVYLVGICHTESTAATKNPKQWWYSARDGRMYFAFSPHGGKDNPSLTSTGVYEIGGQFGGPNPDVLAPVFWVDPAGDAENSGYDPRNAFPSVFAAISTTSALSQDLPYGSCFMVGSTAYTEDAFKYGDWGTGTVPRATASGAQSQLRGDGKDQTSITFNAATVALTQDGATNIDFLISDLSIDFNAITSEAVLGDATNYGKLTFQDCEVDASSFTGSSGIRVKNQLVKMYRTKWVQQADSDVSGLVRALDSSPGTECRFEAYSCILRGGNWTLWAGADGQIKTANSVVTDYYNAGYRSQGGTASGPEMRATAIYSGPSSDATATPFDDDASLTYTDVDFCIMDKGSSDGTTDAEYGPGSQIVADVGTAGAVYVDPANDDFTPVAGAEAVGAGTSLPHEFGIDGRPLKNPPSVGPVEFQPGVRVASS